MGHRAAHGQDCRVSLPWPLSPVSITQVPPGGSAPSLKPPGKTRWCQGDLGSAGLCSALSALISGQGCLGVLRNNTEMLCAVYPVSPNGTVLKNYSITSHGKDTDTDSEHPSLQRSCLLPFCSHAHLYDSWQPLICLPFLSFGHFKNVI